MNLRILTGVLALLSSTAFGCEFKQVQFDNNFSAAGLDQCQQVGENQFVLTVKPEGTPINSSPWYGFKVKAIDERDIHIRLTNTQGRNRYLPKFSVDGQHWQGLDYVIDGNDIRFTLPVTSQPVWVAGQEILNNEFYVAWLKALAEADGLKISTLGQSAQGRDILIAEQHTGHKEWVVLLGRQHPPEITGALALLPFVETLVMDSALAAYRQRFNLLIIPNLNPDGVEHGFWRFNSKGVDLNRDWKTFVQPETRLVRDKLAQIEAAGGNIVFALDFHSTHKDVFYTMPESHGQVPPKLAHQWLDSLQKATWPAFKVRPTPGNNPNRGVFKQFIADVYGVHGVTYEMGDNTNRALIRSVAQQAAQTLAEHLLVTPEKAFYVKP